MIQSFMQQQKLPSAIPTPGQQSEYSTHITFSSHYAEDGTLLNRPGSLDLYNLAHATRFFNVAHATRFCIRFVTTVAKD